MSFYQGDNEFYVLTELVKTCQINNMVDKRLEMTHNLCQMLSTQQLDEAMTKMVKSMERYTQDLLMNPNFRRSVHKRHALMEREPIVYFGDNVLKDDAYDYDEELEKKITEVEFKITTFLGNVLAYIQKEQGSM